jgi:hypothetical protein
MAGSPVRLVLVAVGAMALPPRLSGLAQQPSPPRTRYWYSPRGKTCPWYAYEPHTVGSRADAKAACQKLNATTCVAHRGPATPECPLGR